MRVTAAYAKQLQRAQQGKITLAEATQLGMSEDDFLSWLIATAHMLGWKIVHFRASRTGRVDSKGRPIYRTAVQGDGEGWVDCELWRERIIHAELKSETGPLEPEQRLRRDELIAAGAEWYCWHPRDMSEIERILTTKGDGHDQTTI